MRVEAYYNLHRRCLSYRPSGGKVQHANTLLLNDVKFAVQPAGREKVRLDTRKNVHAFVRGELVFVQRTIHDDPTDVTIAAMERRGLRKITYNPYKYDSFVYRDTEEPIYEAQQVAIIGKDIWVVEEK